MEILTHCPDCKIILTEISFNGIQPPNDIWKICANNICKSKFEQILNTYDLRKSNGTVHNQRFNTKHFLVSAYERNVYIYDINSQKRLMILTDYTIDMSNLELFNQKVKNLILFA